MKKGSTLAEVLVSMAVFALTVVTVLGVYLSAVRAKNKQKEYLYFESVCLDIDYYYDNYGDWAIRYFGDERTEQYYGADFSRTEEAGKYTLTYTFGEEGLIVWVRNNEGGYFVIENLCYGRSKNA